MATFAHMFLQMEGPRQLSVMHTFGQKIWTATRVTFDCRKEFCSFNFEAPFLKRKIARYLPISRYPLINARLM